MSGDPGSSAARPPAPLRVRRRAVTRQDISDAAVDLFERQGYENTTVEQIADAAGVSLRTFYRYCSSKDEVLTFGLPAGPAELAAAVRSRPQLPLREAVIDAFVSAAEGASRQRELRVLISTPALRAAWLAAGREAQDDLTEVILERFPDQPALRARSQAAAIAGVLTMVIEIWAFSDGERLEPLTRQALDIIDAGPEVDPTVASG